MNLEMIQSRIQDIEQMRSASNENEAALMKWKGRNGTDRLDEPISSLSFRFFLALAILAFLIYADYRELPRTGNLLTEAENAISYNIKLEDMENLEQIWYTISETIRLPGQKESNEKG